MKIYAYVHDYNMQAKKEKGFIHEEIWPPFLEDFL
jgi:hypothetical protein